MSSGGRASAAASVRGQDIGIIGRSRLKPQYQLEPVLADYCIES